MKVIEKTIRGGSNPRGGKREAGEPNSREFKQAVEQFVIKVKEANTKEV